MSRNTDEARLSSSQLRSLFDVLTHNESYDEIQNLKHSSVISDFGHPIQTSERAPSSSPLLQNLLCRFITSLPGLRDVTAEAWSGKIAVLASALADCNLSESYDKGAIGIRRTLSTAIASIVESVSRGVLGGLAKQPGVPGRKYDPSNPEDVQTAWDDLLQQAVEGDLVDDLFAKIAATDKLSEQSSLVQSAHQYIIITLASFMHYTLIVSPRGQTMLPLLVRANDLLPYFVIRQTLKVGNAASMVNGLVKVVLAKMNMSSFAGWFGGAPSDSGMNLLHIISTVLTWDVNVLKKRASSVEKQQGTLTTSDLVAIREYCHMSHEDQQVIRDHSTSDQSSVIKAIFRHGGKDNYIDTEGHKKALEYLAIQLSISDRDKLIQSLCNRQPDILTSTIRIVVAAYEPIIRSLHKAVNLSDGVHDMQQFMSDLIDLARVDCRTAAKTPTVEDFCILLQKHSESSHRFLHQILKNSPQSRQMYLEYSHLALSQYKCKGRQGADDQASGAGDMSVDLQDLYTSLSPEAKATVSEELEHYTHYLYTLQIKSSGKLTAVVENLAKETSETKLGPGIFLAKWQALIDATPITPEYMEAPVRTANSKSVKDATAIDTDGGNRGLLASQHNEQDEYPAQPSCSETVRNNKSCSRATTIYEQWGVDIQDFNVFKVKILNLRLLPSKTSRPSLSSISEHYAAKLYLTYQM
ncbi:uncharacterized protein KY384_007612 [Bacidia gigantensis]|uniref:uncharacterized protein n=1 Tax=Bacidia gigantensis TaxID=2732470 RepID=UPI001D0533C2|nr:uncharacterized protein KY384_007612 [Bacidia gigantensis]KAG8527460.1 hypothetical protein KY384_007612 [Bacidia gigantensis]